MTDLFKTASQRFSKQLNKAGNFDENEHPRAQDGKFTSGGGPAGASPVKVGESGGQRARRYAAIAVGAAGGAVLNRHMRVGGPVVDSIAGALLGGTAANAIVRQRRINRQNRIVHDAMVRGQQIADRK